MKVFLSWSGAQSRAVAEALYAWLPQIIQAVDPFLSGEIDKGTRWSSEIDNALEGTSFGIICLTRDNLTAPWILYEAGALAKTKGALIWTLLLDLAPTDVQSPLAGFQHTTAEKSDILRLLHTINRQVEKSGERSLRDHALDGVFELFWPQLSAKINAAAEFKSTASGSIRSDRELLEEILERLRQGEQQTPKTITYRAVAYLAKFVEPALKSREPLASADINWTVTSDSAAIYLHAERKSDGARFDVSVPVRNDWPEGTSWSYAGTIAEELKRLLGSALHIDETERLRTANTGAPPDG